MYKCETLLNYFKIKSSSTHTSPIKVVWYVLEQGDETDEIGRCFTQTELQQFLNFATRNPINFPNGKNHFNCSEEENLPYCSMYSIVPKQTGFPDNLILRQQPNLSNKSIYTCMDIVLTNLSCNVNHNYNLVFDVIGRIEM